jgi:hypothetical protein
MLGAARKPRSPGRSRSERSPGGAKRSPGARRSPGAKRSPGRAKRSPASAAVRSRNTTRVRDAPSPADLRLPGGEHPQHQQLPIASSSMSDLRPFIERVLLHANPRKHAVVFDIDATVLFNDRRCTRSLEVRTNNNVRFMYDMALAQKVPIFLITARPDVEGNRESTVEQLSVLGYTPDTYKKLFLMSNSIEHRVDIAQYKFEKRKQVWDDHGLVTLLNVGDSWTDVIPVKRRDQIETLNKNQTMFVAFQPPDAYVALAVKLPNEK